ncbi:MAG: hypothetical protein GY906_05475 [bacterium]|nr:hypothetical protein [bacterium]
MGFPTEPQSFERGVLSDLQGAWMLLRDSIAASSGFDGVDKALLYIDEAMSWEVVRHLESMPPLLLLIRNLCVQGSVSSEVMENLELLTQLMDDVQAKVAKGELL